MKKELFVRKTREEKLLHKDWYSLGARDGYWQGSPWRAIGALLRDRQDG